MERRRRGQRVSTIAATSVLVGRLPAPVTHGSYDRLLRLRLRLRRLRLRLLRLAVEPAIQLDVRYRSRGRILGGAALLGAAEPRDGQLWRGNQKGCPILSREHRLALRRRGNNDRRGWRPAQQGGRLLARAVIGTVPTLLRADIPVRVHLAPGFLSVVASRGHFLQQPTRIVLGWISYFGSKMLHFSREGKIALKESNVDHDNFAILMLSVKVSVFVNESFKQLRYTNFRNLILLQMNKDLSRKDWRIYVKKINL